MLKKVFLLPLLLIPVVLLSQSIEWMTIEEAVEKSREEPRKIFVDVYTDWCGWCKRMDNNTFKDPEVVEYLNKHFYAVKLDGEETDTIRLNDNIYTNPNPGGKRSAHELAKLFLQGRTVYPSFAFFDENLETVLIARGYQKPPQLLKMLRFLHEEHYKEMDWETFVE
ncbi:MAG: DUF255 domain-containing protein [Bacteroidales bacterium]